MKKGTNTPASVVLRGQGKVPREPKKTLISPSASRRSSSRSSFSIVVTTKSNSDADNGEKGSDKDVKLHPMLSTDIQEDEHRSAFSATEPSSEEA